MEYYPDLLTRTMVDEVTPNWHRKKNCGVIVNNPMTKTTVHVECTTASIDYAATFLNGTCPTCGYNTYSGTRMRGLLPASYYTGNYFAPSPAISEGNIRDIATTGAWAKAQQSEVLLGTVLAEGHKTIQSFVAIAKRLIHIGRNLRRLKLHKLAKELTAKELSNRWMEGRYAIRPFIYDVKGVLEALTAEKNPDWQTFRSGSSVSGVVTQNDVVVRDDSSVRVTVGASAYRVITARAGVLCFVKPDSPAVWGLDQPLETLWELVPFSFVVDWFFNVGKTVAAWTPNPGVHALASWVSVEDVLTQTTQISSVASKPNASLNHENFWHCGGGRVTKTTTSKYRVVNPNLSFVPSWNMKLDWAKFLDLAIMGKRFFR